MRLEVLTVQWGAGDEVYAGGVHDDVKLTRQLAPLVAGAEAAGTIVVLDATAAERKLLRPHVQPQDAGEKAYQKAVDAGRWQHGNLVQFVADREDRLAAGEGDKATLKAELAAARALLAETEEPT